MSTAADYLNRTVDVLAFAGVEKDRAGIEVLLAQTLARNGLGGDVCTGIQKLAQRWLIEFLTENGTMQYLPVRGCVFMGELRRRQLRTSLDAQQSFYLSVSQVKTNLQREEDETMPADERYASVELLALVVAGDTLTLRVQINSAAGTSRKVILPIAVTVGA